MGCDIHLFVEKKEGRKWVAVPGSFYHDRNYDLFAMLADVRNGRGFAGCETGSGYIPISTPKGLPKNVSKEIKEESEGWGCDGHSHSWLTLKELEAYDWDQVTYSIGMVDANEYVRFKKEGRPHCWSGGVGGANVRIVSNAEMDEALKDASKADGNSLYTQIKWRVTYREGARWFIGDVLPQLRELSPDNPENVRIVFWFDN